MNLVKSFDLKENYLHIVRSSLLNHFYLELEAKLFHVFSAGAQRKIMNLRDFRDPELFKPHETLIRSVRKDGHTLVITGLDDDNRPTKRLDLRNIIEHAHTMIGEKRLDNVRYCVEKVLEEKIPGDFIETGIWRGGVIIYMLAILNANFIVDRKIWAADSFDGVPVPTLEQDLELDISKNVLPVLAVSIEEVKELILRYNLSLDNIEFLQGWFKDTLNTDRIERLAILRLDGDLYESTMDSLIPLYPKVSTGGFIIVDDYESCPPCKVAVTEFRNKHNISSPLIRIDEHAVYWRKDA